MNILSNKAFLLGALCLGFVSLAQGSWSGPEKNKNIIGSGEFGCDDFVINYIKYQDEDCYRCQAKIKGNQQSVVEFSFNCDKLALLYKHFQSTLVPECKACKQNNTSIVERVNKLALTDKRIFGIKGVSGMKVVEQDLSVAAKSADQLIYYIDCNVRDRNIKIKVVNCQNNYGGLQYKIDVDEGADVREEIKKETINLKDCNNKISFDVVKIAIERGLFLYANPNNETSGLSCTECVFNAFKQEGFSYSKNLFKSSDVMNVFHRFFRKAEPGFLHKAWNVITSKWVTIPVAACAGLVALCVALDGE